MFRPKNYEGSLREQYSQVVMQLYELCENETNTISNLSNASALLNFFLRDINWVGFYIFDSQKDELVLGPFQGLPACVRIKKGNGVCGAVARDLKTLRAEDVDKFEGHIACDSNSRSEIVIPIFKNGDFFGVLDIDSPILNRFSDDDEICLEGFVRQLEKHIF